MSDEVERYNFYGDWDRATETDGEYVLFTDLESELQAHAETKAQLEVLEDYIRRLIDVKVPTVLPPSIEQAIHNSKSRQTPPEEHKENCPLCDFPYNSIEHETSCQLYG